LEQEEHKTAFLHIVPLVRATYFTFLKSSWTNSLWSVLQQSHCTGL